MTNRDSSSRDDGARIFSFRGRAVFGPFSEPVEDLRKYEQSRESADDYRHRMVVNILTFLFVAALIGVGLWLAGTIADMRRGEDCVLSGRRGCTSVEINGSRW